MSKTWKEKIMETLRINKAMADRGLATRRQADELIKAGLVYINGQQAVLGDRVTESDILEIRDAEGTYTPDYEYIVYYKPKGIVTHSASGRQQEIKDISGYPDLFPVGRLDKESEGLLILTNDGRITERLLHPRFAHEKEYFVEFKGNFPKNGEQKLVKGIESEGEVLRAKRIELLTRKTVCITLTEGKHHQVRRMLEALGLEVITLKRTRIMGVYLGALKPGKARVLRGKALKAFLQDLHLK